MKNKSLIRKSRISLLFPEGNNNIAELLHKTIFLASMSTELFIRERYYNE
jgi:hypothetical protein